MYSIKELHAGKLCSWRVALQGRRRVVQRVRAHHRSHITSAAAGTQAPRRQAAAAAPSASEMLGDLSPDTGTVGAKDVDEEYGSGSDLQVQDKAFPDAAKGAIECTIHRRRRRCRKAGNC